MATTTALLTFEEFERLPDQPGKQELLKGELVEMPPAESQHNRTGLSIFRVIDAALTAAHANSEAAELGEVFPEMGYRFGRNTWLQPDVSVTHAGQNEGKYFEGAPAIAIEVISPGNSAEEIRQKTDLYFQHGAREVWRLYPKTRQIVVDLPGSARVYNEHDHVTTPLLPGFSLTLASILPPQS